MAKISPTCLKCGDDTAVVCLRMDAEDEPTFKCEGCDAEYTCDDVRAALDVWQKVLKWVEAMPDA